MNSKRPGSICSVLAVDFVTIFEDVTVHFTPFSGTF